MPNSELDIFGGKRTPRLGAYMPLRWADLRLVSPHSIDTDSSQMTLAFETSTNQMTTLAVY